MKRITAWSEAAVLLVKHLFFTPSTRSYPAKLATVGNVAAPVVVPTTEEQPPAQPAVFVDSEDDDDLFPSTDTPVNGYQFVEPSAPTDMSASTAAVQTAPVAPGRTDPGTTESEADTVGPPTPGVKNNARKRKRDPQTEDEGEGENDDEVKEPGKDDLAFMDENDNEPINASPKPTGKSTGMLKKNKKAPAKPRAKAAGKKTPVAKKPKAGRLASKKSKAASKADEEDDAVGDEGAAAQEEKPVEMEMVTPEGAPGSKETKTSWGKATEHIEKGLEVEPDSVPENAYEGATENKDEIVPDSDDEGSPAGKLAPKGKGAKKATKGKSPGTKVAKTIAKKAGGKTAKTAKAGKGKGKKAKEPELTDDEEEDEVDDDNDQDFEEPMAKGSKKAAPKKKLGKKEAALKADMDSKGKAATPKKAAKKTVTPKKAAAKKESAATTNTTPKKTAKATPKTTPKKGLLKGKASKVEKKETPKKGTPKKGTPKKKASKTEEEPASPAPEEGSAEKERKYVPRATLGRISCSTRDEAVMSLAEHAIGQLGGYSMADGGNRLPLSAYVIGADTKRGWGILHALAKGYPLVSDAWLSESISNGKWLPVDEFLNTKFKKNARPTEPALAGMRVRFAAKGPEAPMMKKTVTAAGGRVAQTRVDVVVNDGCEVVEGVVNVTKTWLADCVEQGKRMEFEGYVVGGEVEAEAE